MTKKKDETLFEFGSLGDLANGVEIFLNRVHDINRKGYRKQANQEDETRSKWKDDIIHVLRAAAGEFYKCRLHDKIKAAHKDRQHWEKEWRWQLTFNLLREMSDTTTFKDKKRAAEEAFVEFADTNHSSLTMAINTLSKYLDEKVNKLKRQLTQGDVADFYKEVNAAFTKHLSTLSDKDFKFPKLPDEYPEVKLKVLKVEEEKPWNNKARKKRKK